jgi:hypothetical protein
MVAAACSRETPAPPPVETKTAAETPPVSAAIPRSYDDAITWFRATPGFHFVVDEGGVHAEGDMTRERVGAERVTVSVNGEEWSAAIGPKGVTWQRGGKESPAPEWGNRVFQRVTVAFDPEKQEGQAQVLEPGHYRFTDANSGQLHEVWTNASGQITRMTIGKAFSMTLTNQR